MKYVWMDQTLQRCQRIPRRKEVIVNIEVDQAACFPVDFMPHFNSQTENSDKTVSVSVVRRHSLNYLSSTETIHNKLHKARTW